MILLLVAAVLVVDGVAGERGWLANRRAEARYAAEERALNAERARNEALREEIRRLRAGDPAIVEELARRHLRLMKPGEKVFIVRDRVKAK